VIEEINLKSLLKGYRSRCKAFFLDYVCDYIAYRITLFQRGQRWTYLHNRGESAIESPAGIGVYCDWAGTSPLVAPNRMPSLGRRLLKRAMDDFPIGILAPNTAPLISADPEISFIITHRGLERLENLLTTLRSVGGQEGVRFECIVVEQDQKSLLSERLPSWVRFIHVSEPAKNMPFCHSWVSNVGARQAKGKLLVFHDNDILVQRNYGACLRQIASLGYDAINLKRFVFHLSREHSRHVLDSGMVSTGSAPEKIIQNNHGASTCFDREKFLEIGGYDEALVGWGYEDNELWDRASLLNTYNYGHLPFIHLWHEAQPDKNAAVVQKSDTATLYKRLLEEPAKLRVRTLSARKFGDPNKLDPPFFSKQML